MGALFHNDTERVAALRSYNILDTAPEPAYEEITKIAADIDKSGAAKAQKATEANVKKMDAAIFALQTNLKAK